MFALRSICTRRLAVAESTFDSQSQSILQNWVDTEWGSEAWYCSSRPLLKPISWPMGKKEWGERRMERRAISAPESWYERDSSVNSANQSVSIEQRKLYSWYYPNYLQNHWYWQDYLRFYMYHYCDLTKYSKLHSFCINLNNNAIVFSTFYIKLNNILKLLCLFTFTKLSILLLTFTFTNLSSFLIISHCPSHPYNA